MAIVVTRERARERDVLMRDLSMRGTCRGRRIGEPRIRFKRGWREYRAAIPRGSPSAPDADILALLHAAHRLIRTATMLSQRPTIAIPFGLSLSKPFDKLRANGSRRP